MRFRHWRFAIAAVAAPLAIVVAAALSLLAATPAAAGTIYNVTATIGVGGYPDGVAVDPATQTVYVANATSGTVSVIDEANDAVNTIELPDQPASPAGVAVDPVSDTIYVTDQFNACVWVINGANDAVEYSVPVGNDPVSVAVDPVDNTVWVANESDNSVSDFAEGSRQLGNVGALPARPYAVAVDTATDTIYVSAPSAGQVFLVNPADGALAGQIQMPGDPGGLVFDAATNTMYVGNSGGGSSGSVSAIDGNTNTITANVFTNSDVGGVGVDTSNDTVYGVTGGSGVAVIDGASNTLVTYVGGIGTAPSGIGVDSTNHLAYVASTVNDIVSVISPQFVPDTTTTLTSSANPSTVGQSVTFTATVSPTSGTGVPTGAVSFYDGGTLLGSPVGLNGSGTATYTTSTLAVGTHTITATYSGDNPNFFTSTGTLTQTVNENTTTTAITSSANPSTYQESVTFTATVTPTSGTGVPTGTVTFSDNGTQMGTPVTLNGSGTATISTPAYPIYFMPVGAQTINAAYSGDGTFSGSSGSLTETVDQDPTTTTLSSQSFVLFEEQIPLEAQVDPVDGNCSCGTYPTGTVTFAIDGTTVDTETVDYYGQEYTPYNLTSAVTPGIHTLTATYSGDGNYAGSMASATFTVEPYTSNAVLTSSANPSTYGQSVTFTTTVTAATGPEPGYAPPGAPAPTGTVTYYDNGTTLGTATLNSSGVATFSISTLAAQGYDHNIYANYSGDTNYGAYYGAGVEQNVNPVATTTAITSSANPSTYGQSVTFTATVSPTSGSGIPDGTLHFYVDGAQVSIVGLNAGGAATYTTSSLAVGTHSITTYYYDTSDGNFGASNGSLTQTVNKPGTSTALTSSLNPSTYGQSVTFTATVSPTSGTGTPTGTVTFYDGTTAIGSGTLSNGQATFATTSLAAGTHSITAIYGGDGNFNGSTSSAVTQTVKQVTTTTTVTTSGSPTATGASVTYTATVSPTPDGGTVAFVDGTTTITGCSAQPVNTGTGKATCTTKPTTTGAHNVKATFSGTANYTGSTSATVTQVVTSTSCSTLAGCNLTGLNLSGAQLAGANLSGANLTSANLSGANLTGATLTGANLTNANLSGANLTSANLTGANLSNANLSNANLTSANMTGANMTKANLTGATLTGANLTGANVTGANFTNANASKANLTGANLTSANMTGANLTGTTVTSSTNVSSITWSNTTCTDGTNSTADHGTCVGHL